MKKRALSILLALVLCLSLLPTAALAEDDLLAIESDTLTACEGGDNGPAFFDASRETQTLSDDGDPDPAPDVPDETKTLPGDGGSDPAPDAPGGTETVSDGDDPDPVPDAPNEAETPSGDGPSASSPADFTIKDGVLTKYSGSDVTVTVPAGVKRIARGAFSFNRTMRVLILPDGLTTLDYCACQNCWSLTDVTIPASVKSMGIGAYQGPFIMMTNDGELTMYDIMPNLTIHGARGSYAEKWAREEEQHPFVADLAPVGETSYTVTVIPGCGENYTLTVTNGQRYGELTPPTRSGYIFKGWFDDRTGDEITASTVVSLSRNQTVVARWEREVVYTAPGGYTYTSGMTTEEVQQRAIDSYQNDPAYQKRVAANRTFLAGGIKEEDYVYTIVTDGVQTLSDELCAGASTDEEKVRAIHDWVVYNVYYYGPAGCRWKTAQEVMTSGLGVCSDYTILVQALCWAQDIPCVYVSGTTGDPRGHAWNAVLLDGQWRWIDATWDNFNKAYDTDGGVWKIRGETRTNYYLCSTEYISIDHEAQNVRAINKINANIPSQTPAETKKIVAAEDELRKNPAINPAEKTTQKNPSTGTTEKTTQKSPTTGAEKTVSAISRDKTISAWAAPEVEKAAGCGLILDDMTTSFSAKITRQDFCRLAVNLIERHTGKSIEAFAASRGKTITDPFSDTDHAAVLAACALGIVTGRGNGVFDPNGSITRQEAAAMLARTAKILGVSAGKGLSFGDIGEAGAWSVDSIAFVSGLTDPGSGNAVMGGVGGSRFDPLGTYTREQSIVTMYRLFGVLGN